MLSHQQNCPDTILTNKFRSFTVKMSESLTWTEGCVGAGLDVRAAVVQASPSQSMDMVHG